MRIITQDADYVVSDAINKETDMFFRMKNGVKMRNTKQSYTEHARLLSHPVFSNLIWENVFNDMEFSYLTKTRIYAQTAINLMAMGWTPAENFVKEMEHAVC